MATYEINGQPVSVTDFYIRTGYLLDECDKYQKENGREPNAISNSFGNPFFNEEYYNKERELMALVDDEQFIYKIQVGDIEISGNLPNVCKSYEDIVRKDYNRINTLGFGSIANPVVDENNEKYYDKYPTHVLEELLKTSISPQIKKAIKENIINRQQIITQDDIKEAKRSVAQDVLGPKNIYPQIPNPADWKFGIGKKETEGKLDYSEINLEILDLMAVRFAANKVKYKKGNTKLPIPIEDILQASFRHLRKMIQPLKNDEETFKDHLAAILTNMSIILDQLTLQDKK